MSVRRNLARVHDEKAQGAIEFALIATILMIVFLGTVDFGRFAYYDTAVRNAARTGVTMAMRHCSSPSSCGSVSTPMSNDVILHSTVCEAQPYVSLDPPAYSSCDPCDSGTCGGACSGQTDCTTTDIRIVGSTSPRIRFGTVTVTVGYNFHPLTFLMDKFFTTDANSPWNKGCWTGDPVQTHTICVTYTGKIY